MKKQINALQLHYLLKELKLLIGGKIDKIYQPEKKELVFVFHVPSKGKYFLRAAVPDQFYLAELKGDTPEKPAHFCTYLRKHLSNARLRDIKQKGFERVVEFTFEKEKKMHLIFELFSKGNIVLTDDKYNIMMPLEVQKWKARQVTHKREYKFPERDINFLKLTFDELKQLIEKSDKDSIAVMLAVELGLGGVYAEELLLMAGIDKKKKKLDDKELKNLFKQCTEIANKKLQPHTYFKKDVVEDITPFEMLRYKDLKSETSSSLNHALDSVLSAQKKEDAKKDTTHNKRIEELKRIINKQELRFKEIENAIEENKQKGELIYENYQKVDALLKEIKKLKEKHEWGEIKKLLKEKNIELNTKDKTITLDI